MSAFMRNLFCFTPANLPEDFLDNVYSSRTVSLVFCVIFMQSCKKGYYKDLKK